MHTSKRRKIDTPEIPAKQNPPAVFSLAQDPGHFGNQGIAVDFHPNPQPSIAEKPLVALPLLDLQECHLNSFLPRIQRHGAPDASGEYNFSFELPQSSDDKVSLKNKPLIGNSGYGSDSD